MPRGEEWLFEVRVLPLLVRSTTRLSMSGVASRLMSAGNTSARSAPSGDG
jgi:hypothetical protein